MTISEFIPTGETSDVNHDTIFSAIHFFFLCMRRYVRSLNGVITNREGEILYRGLTQSRISRDTTDLFIKLVSVDYTDYEVHRLFTYFSKITDYEAHRLFHIFQQNHRLRSSQIISHIPAKLRITKLTDYLHIPAKLRITKLADYLHTSAELQLTKLTDYLHIQM